MGKKKAVKKGELNTKEPKPSTSKKNIKRTMDKTKDGLIEKKMKKESKAKSQQSTRVKKSSINDLPPEMLMQILKHLNEKELFDSRLVNGKWNVMASTILQSREFVEIEFEFSNKNGNPEFKQAFRKNKTERSLLDYIECFCESKDFPFAQFCFGQVELSMFEHEDWITFISDFKEHVKSLKLKVPAISNDEDFLKVTERVRDLLLNKLPDLEKFGIGFDSCHLTINGPEIRLFPTNEETTPAQLPQLKVLYIDDSAFLKFPGIVTDLLTAAVKLQKLDRVNCYMKHTDFEKFPLLQKLGKLNCLESASIAKDCLSKIKEKSSPVPLDFKLKSLVLYADTIFENPSVSSNATVFIANLFESSKDTLTHLETDSLRFLHNLKLSEFSKLTTLSVQTRFGSGNILPPILPREINPMKLFPVLKCLVLEVHWTDVFSKEDKISCIPTLETLVIGVSQINELDIAQISIMCPNLKDLDFSEPLLGWIFPEIAGAIFTHLKKLRSLEIKSYTHYQGNDFPDFDSCITGFSEEDCILLYDLLSAEQLLRKHGCEAKIPKSKLTPERVYPSILDLKDLTTFEFSLVHLKGNSTEIELDLTDLTKRGPTLVSEKCALDFMENLVYTIEKEVDPDY